MRLPTTLVIAEAHGNVLYCEDGLSFWGGVDPQTGIIIDAHHPNHGASLAGHIVLMPTSRGSCSGSGVLLELARNGNAPAALVFREAEDILTLGAMIAAQLFDRPIAVLRLPADVFNKLSTVQHATINNNTLEFEGQSIALVEGSADELDLSTNDQKMLQGHEQSDRYA